jgi:adenylosuccinate synthase
MSKAILVQGLAYGDEAKGATVDFLCRQLPVDLVVRFNGGSQAAHNVVTPEGAHHTFSQFGSGMLANNKVRTHLSRFMLVDPLTMMNEAKALQSEQAFVHGLWNRTTVDPRCVVITPFHKRLNRLREEKRGDARYGSCGMGVGAAREWHLQYGEDVLLAGDVLDYDKTVKKLRFLRDLLFAETGIDTLLFGDYELGHLRYDYTNVWANRVNFSETLPSSDLAVFEGAQGVLLDETHGETDHNTWTDCTFANADALLDEVGMAEEDRLRIGCLRTYLTRHGHGPFKAFDGGSYIEEPHNDTNQWQGVFRSGPMDYELIRKSLGHIGVVDCIALSHMDCVDPTYQNWVEQFERQLVTTVGITSNGPTALHREFTPGWSQAVSFWAGEAVW